MKVFLEKVLTRLADPERRGLIGAVTLFVALGLINLAIVPWDYAPDEPRNAAYGFELWSGRLPTVNDPLPHAEMGTKKLRKSDFHASAQHPPLYYASIGGPIKASVALFGSVMPGLYVARLMTLAFGAAAVVMLHRLVRLVIPGRPDVAIATAAIFGSLPQVVNVFSIVYNDALGTFTTLGVLVSSLTILREGPTRRRMIACAVWMGLASLSRFAGVLTTVVGLGAVFLSAFTHGEGHLGRRVLSGIGRVLPLAGVVAVVAGWFYARNYLLYGDVTGAKELFDILDRPKRGTFTGRALDHEVWLTFHDQLWRRLAGSARFLDGSLAVTRGFSSVATAMALYAGVLAVLRAFRHRPPLAHVLTGLVLVIFFFATLLPPIAFHAKGGTLMVRYCLPAVWIPCLVGVLGFAAVRSRGPLQTAIVLLGMFSIMTFELYAIDMLGLIKGSEFGIVLAMGERGLPLPQSFYAAAISLAAAGIALAVTAVGELERPRGAPAEAAAAPP